MIQVWETAYEPAGTYQSYQGVNMSVNVSVNVNVNVSLNANLHTA